MSFPDDKEKRQDDHNHNEKHRYRREFIAKNKFDPANMEKLNLRILRGNQQPNTRVVRHSNDNRFGGTRRRRQSDNNNDREEETGGAAAATFAMPKPMSSAMRLIDDTDGMEFLDFCKEYLMDFNRGFTVVGAIGGQSTGKSTVLSMLAGNEPGDMYRHYAFRPFYREGSDTSRHQTTKIYIYINKWRTVFIDCQPLGSSTLLSDFLASHRRFSKDQAVDQFELMSLQILTLMTRICDTLLFCVDKFINMSIVGDILRTELFKERIESTTTRSVNIVILHQNVRTEDFEPLKILERMRLLKSIFNESSFDIHGNVNLASMGFPRYRWMDCDVNYVPLGKMPPMKFGRGENSTNASGEYFEDDSLSYANIIHALRTKLLTLRRQNSNLTELEWFVSASKQWDRILKELKVGFNDSLQKNHFRYRRERDGRNDFSRIDRRKVNDTDENVSDAEKLSDQNMYGEADRLSPPRRRYFTTPRRRGEFTKESSYETRRNRRNNRRQFFVDDRKDLSESDWRSDVHESPGIYKIKRRTSTKDEDNCSDDDDEVSIKSNDEEDDRSLSVSGEQKETTTPIRKKEDQKGGGYYSPEQGEAEENRKKRKSYMGESIYERDNHIDRRYYDMVKKKIFAANEQKNDSSKPILDNTTNTPSSSTTRIAKREKLSPTPGLSKKSESSVDLSNNDEHSQHDAFCSQALSDLYVEDFKQ